MESEEVMAACIASVFKIFGSKGNENTEGRVAWVKVGFFIDGKWSSFGMRLSTNGAWGDRERS